MLSFCFQIPSLTSNGDLTGGGGAGSPPWQSAARGGSAASLQTCSTMGSAAGAAAVAGAAAGAGTIGSLFVQRVLGHCHKGPRHSPSLLLASVSRRSPRILITRAFSEESESGPPGAPSAPMQHSSSASALVTDRRWRRIRYRDQDEDPDEDAALCRDGLPLSDDSMSSPSEQPVLQDGPGPLSEGEADCEEERAPLFSPRSVSPISSPEPDHHEDLFDGVLRKALGEVTLDLSEA